MENKSRRGDSGRKGSILFQDFQNLQRIWTAPKVLRYNSDRYEIEMQRRKDLESEDESIGSIKDFIDDSEGDTTPTDSDDSSDDEDDECGSIQSDEGGKKKKKKKNKAIPLPRKTRAMAAACKLKFSCIKSSFKLNEIHSQVHPITTKRSNYYFNKKQKIQLNGGCKFVPKKSSTISNIPVN